MKRNDTKRGRFYEIDGKQYPSVTSILQIVGKPALVNWAANVERELVMECSADLYLDAAGTPPMNRNAWLTTLQARLGKEKAHKKELAKAAEIGTQIHALVEWTLKGELCHKVGPSPMICDKAQWGFMAWEDWRKKVNLKPIFIEQTVYSKEYGYAGTLDLLAEVEGKLTVLDWKSGKQIYPESRLQNAAYRHAIREMKHGDPVQGIIVRLPKVETDPEFQAFTVPDDEDYLFGQFLRAMGLWEWQQRNEDAYWEKREKAESESVTV
jgi:hypothetical protein